MSKPLPLVNGTRTTVYTMIVAALKADPTLKRLVQPSSWMTYTGEQASNIPFSSGTYPSIEILPFGQGASPETPVMQNSPMGIRISIVTEGIDVRDLLNMWEAIEAALFTGDGGKVLNTKIRQALADLGHGSSLQTLRLSSPGIDMATGPKGNQIMAATGTITAELTVRK